MTNPVLIVEDDPMQREMLGTLLRHKLNFGFYAAEHGREALDLLETEAAQTIKLIIMDLQMPVMGGLETLDILKQKHPHLPVIMLTGSRDADDVVKAMQKGAIDFLTKPFDSARMIVTVKNALKISVLSKEVWRLQKEQDGTFTFDNLIGHDAGLSAVVNIGRKAAASDIPLLITGETGTGKEVFAQAVHGESARAGKPFIAVNCGAIPSQLVESTLFGHEKGAFTGAIEKTIGKFREAEGGTIFLDEVGELPLDTQVKLLRVLQQKEVEPVGATKPVGLNVRIISATNRDLQEEVDGRRFREDLFFRLNVLQIQLPSLRDRKQDIAALADHFIERFCANEGRQPKVISQETHRQLTAYSWPGNVRQLENIISRSMVTSDGNILHVEGLQGMVNNPEAVRNVDQSPHQKDICVISGSNDFKTIYEIEQEAIHIALNHFDHNITKASKALGIAKSTFYKKIKILENS